MSKENDPYKSIIRVFDSEREINEFFSQHEGEGWVLNSGKDVNNRNIDCIWTNSKGNVIVKEKGDNFYTMCKSMADFFRLQDSWEVDSGLREFPGFDDDFLVSVSFMADQFCRKYIGCDKSSFTKDEFRRIAESCTIENFCKERDMALATAYCGQFIVVNVSGFSWKIEKKEKGNIVEIIPYVFSNEYGKVFPEYEILHSMDKRYSDEFLWGAIPFELQRSIQKKTGDNIV